MKHSIYLTLCMAVAMCIAVSMDANAQQNGRASYYHNSLHGRTMSNGQPYDRNRLTCAHRTLPFGTKLRVTNQANGKQVIVEVTDRGPFVRGRVIDLSYAAAREIGMIATGVGSIRIEVLPKDITIPYQSDGEFGGMPEIEYGMAGVCYEFIPEWSEEQGADEGSAVREGEGTKEQEDEGAKVPPRTQSPSQKTQSTQNTQKPKKEGSRSWTDFFDKLKNWGQ